MSEIKNLDSSITITTEMYTSDGKKLLSLEESLENVKVGPYQYRLLFLCGLAFMTDAMEVNLLSFLSICAGVDWNLSDAQIASISSVVFAGILSGSLFWGLFADRFGRRLTFIAATAIISIGGFLSGLAPSYSWLLAFRLFVGFGIGGANVPFDLLAEMLPNSHRGRFLIYIEYFWTFGSLFVAGLAWAILNSSGWRVLTFVTAIPVTIASIFSVFYLPESPRWLLLMGRTEQAEVIVKEAAIVNKITLAPFTIISDSTKVHKDASYLDLILIPQNRNISLPLWSIWFLFGFTYYGLILYVSRLYSNTSKDSGSDTCSFDYQDIFINASSEIIGITFVAFFIDSWGRVRSQSIFYVIGGLAILFMGFDPPNAYVLMLSIIGRIAIMAASSATWVTTPELYCTESRTTGHASCTSISKVGALLSPYFISSSATALTIGIVMCILNCVAAFSSHLLPESTGHTLDEQELPRDGATIQSLVRSSYHRKSSERRSKTRSLSIDRTDTDGGLTKLYHNRAKSQDYHDKNHDNPVAPLHNHNRQNHNTIDHSGVENGWTTSLLHQQS
eukprot:gene7600-10349_t